MDWIRQTEIKELRLSLRGDSYLGEERFENIILSYESFQDDILKSTSHMDKNTNCLLVV